MLESPEAATPAQAVVSAKQSISAYGILTGFNRALQTIPHFADYFGEEEKAYARFAVDFVYQRFPMPSTSLQILGPLLYRAPYAAQQWFYDKNIVPGYDTLFTIRKVMIKELIEQSIREGTEQIIILGGGFDSRGWFSAQAHDGVQYFEIDKGPTRDLKKQLYQAHFNDDIKDQNGYTQVLPNYRLVECDLMALDLKDKLEACGFDKSKKTLVIAEGLSTYLPEDVNKDLLTNQLKDNLLSEEGELLISYGIDPKSDFNKKTLEANGEGHLFYLNFDQIPDFVHDAGWHIDARFTPVTSHKLMSTDLQERYHDFDSFFEMYVKLKPTPIEGQDIRSIPELDLLVFQEGHPLFEAVKAANLNPPKGIFNQFSWGAGTQAEPTADPSQKTGWKCQIL